MAVVVQYNERGDAEIKSLNGVGISGEERRQAFALDALTKVEITALADRLKKENMLPKQGERGKVAVYWDFGLVIRKIFLESDLIKPSEKSFFFESVRYYAGLLAKSLLAEDRSGARNHLDYCFRLSGYPKEIALALQWSEWVFLLDSSSIRREIRFDDWFRNIIKNHQAILNRETLRVFAKILNALIKDIETKDWGTSQLINCYNGAWQILLKVVRNEHFEKQSTRKRIIDNVKDCTLKNRGFFAQLMNGSYSENEFAQRIYDCCVEGSFTRI